MLLFYGVKRLVMNELKFNIIVIVLIFKHLNLTTMRNPIQTLATWMVNGNFVSYMWNSSLDVYFYSVKLRSGITLDFDTKRAAFNCAK